MARTNENAVLELRDKTPDRPFMVMGGERFHFKLRSDLSLNEITAAANIGKRLAALSDGAGIQAMSWRERRRLRGDLRASVRMVMFDMPRRVVRSLSDMECAEVIGAFTIALPDTKTTPPARKQTSSPASSASTRRSRPKR